MTSRIPFAPLTCALALLAGLAGLAAGCPTPPPAEICGNGLDDDENGASDCEDDACAADEACVVVGECTIDVNFPKQSASSAVDIEPNTPLKGTLCPARDDDGYRITVPSPGSVILVTLSMEPDILSRLFLGYTIAKDNGDGTATPTGIIAQDPDPTPNHRRNFTGAHRVEEPGEYIVIVADVEGRDDGFDNVNEYTINVDVVADPDANEPNNAADEARPIAPGETTGIIATSGDQDWYAIEVDGNARIIDAVITAPADSGIEHVATLFAPDGVTILQTAELAPGDVAGEVTTRIRAPASGVAGTPFLLKIEDGGTDGNLDAVLDPAVAGYTVTLQVIADPDAQEGAAGNEEIATATTVTSGQTLTASLATFADQDVYRITPPAGTTVAAPRVLVVEVQFDGTLDASFKPQVQIITTDPEQATIPACNAACQLCLGNNTCGEVRLQRFVQESPFQTAYPLRNTQPIFVVVNEFNDDGAQLTGGYTIRFQVVADTDPGEAGDDFLIANLEEAGFANGDQLAQQRDESKARARQVALGYQPVCDESTPAGAGCLDLVPVANPVGFGFDPMTVACADAPPATRTLTGRLTYEGDRDYFIFPDFPARGYFGVEVEYTVSRDTPVELAIFVHGFNGRALAGSTLEGAVETGTCSEQQGGQNACAPGSICVDERCWTDGATNAATNPSVRFGDDDGGNDDECVVAGPEGFERPVYIEVVDNGLNDFDLDMTYTLNVTVRCGCPSVCDTPQDFCQDG